MKSVLISIKPKWCELIANGKKTVEVRKSRPKIETPFKCYIYCTKIKNTHIDMFLHYDVTENKTHICNGKVIGEFVCDFYDIITFVNTGKDIEFADYLSEYMIKDACLTLQQGFDYANEKPLYGFHISDLVIYEKPKELREFGINRAFQSWGYVESEG